MRAKKQLSLKEVLEKVTNTRTRNMFIPSDAARYELNLARGICEYNNTHVTRNTRDVLLKKSYLARIKAYAPYAHADAVPLSKSEAWLK